MNWLLFFSIHPTFALVSFFIVGAIIGSFLNVIIYRYPIMLEREWNRDCLLHLNQPTPENPPRFNLLLPHSHCAHCKKPIPFWLNIPIISFIALQGKCAFCRQKIPMQFLLVELLSAILSVVIFLQYNISWQALALLIFTWGLIVLSFIDAEHQFLPDAITYSLLWFGLLLSTQHLFVSAASAIFGALIGYLFLYAISKLYILLRKKEGMGLGDCKMLAMIGVWVGATNLLNVLFLAAIFALIINLALILFKKQNKDTLIPFGPYLAISGWFILLFGNQILPGIFEWVR